MNNQATRSVPGKLLVATRSVSYGDGVGGLERAVSDQVRALAALGWDIYVLAPAEFVTGTPLRVSTIDVPWPLKWARPGRPGFGIAYWIWTHRLRRAIQQHSDDAKALYVHGGAAGALRSLGKSRRGLRVVANPHGMEEFERAGFLRLTNRCIVRYLSRGARFADSVIATDPTLVPTVLKRIGVEESKVLVIPNAVDRARLDNLAIEGESKVSEPADIVSVGRLAKNKGYDLLLGAIAQIQRGCDSEPLLWRHFGKGELRDSLAHGASNIPGLRLEIWEAADDAQVQANMRSARVFVQPSRYEGSSLTTLEAMAHGTVCVGTPVGGIPDKIVDGVSGYLADSVSDTDIASAIVRGLDSRPEIGHMARALVAKKYGLEQLCFALDAALKHQPESRVLQVARHIGPGSGVAQVVFSLEKALEAAGVNCDRLTLRDLGLPMKTAISRNPIRKAALFIEVFWFSVAGTLMVSRYTRRYPHAHVVVHGDPIGGDIYVNHGLFKAVVLGRREELGRFYVPLNPMHWFTLLRDEYRYNHVHQGTIVCLSREEQRQLKRAYPRVKTPVTVIPNGVDLKRFRIASALDRSELRAELGLLPTDDVLLFVGHEFHRKGLYLLFRSLSALPDNVKLVVVGGTREMMNEAARQARSMGVEHRIRMTGMQADTARFYSLADLLVLPSSYEAAALVIYEALASGLPCVASPVGLAPEIITPGLNGEFVERSAESIVKGVETTLERIKSDPESIRQICRASVEQYSWDSIARNYLQVLQDK